MEFLTRASCGREFAIDEDENATEINEQIFDVSAKLTAQQNWVPTGDGDQYKGSHWQYENLGPSLKCVGGLTT